MTFILGVIAGGWLFGTLCFVLGGILGYDSGARDVARLFNDAIEFDEAHGDVPNADPFMTWGDR